MAAYEAKEGAQRQWAERFKVSLSYIRGLRRHQRETGTVQPKPPGAEPSRTWAQTSDRPLQLW